MAGETTTTSLTELIYSEWISPFIQSYAAQYLNPSQFFARFDPANGSSTVSVPRWVSDQGTPNDDGVAVDAEYNATEATALSATELETTDSTFSIAEYGLLREISDTSLEDGVINAETLMNQLALDGASTLMAAANDDGCALFAGFTNSSGATTVDLTVADVDDALYDLAERGAMGELVGVLDHEAMRNFQSDLQSTGSTFAKYSGTADRMMAVSASPDQGRNIEGYTLSYKGVDFYRTGLTDTANAGADVVSAIFVRGDIEAQKATAAIGQGSRRDFRVAAERDEAKRTTKVVMTMRWGCGRLIDSNGQKLISDAP